MLPINLDMKKFNKSSEADEVARKKMEEEQKKKKTASSQQALANSLVVGSTPNNPNAGQIAQVPAGQ